MIRKGLYKKNNKELKLCIGLMRAFRVIMYINIGIIVLLFLFLGLSWLRNAKQYNSSGAGMVMVFFYIGPIIALGVISLLLFLVPFIIRLKKRDYATIELEFEKCKKAIGVEVLVSVAAIIIVLMPF